MNGVIAADQVAGAIRPGTEHNPRTAWLRFENTHNNAGGRVFPLDEAQAIAKVARDGGAAVHLDGARLFNAQVASGVPAREWAACADTVTFCFSKGLGAPIGSMVVGNAEVIERAHLLRKRLGGGMRQVGVIAAAARVALETGVDRLAEDHAKAQETRSGSRRAGSLEHRRGGVETNMIYLNLEAFGRQAPEVAADLKKEGVLANGAPGSLDPLGDPSGRERVGHRPRSGGV